MKDLIKILVLLIVNHALTFGQDISEKYPDLIKRVEMINHDKSLTKLSLKNQQFMTEATDGGGELSGFFKDKQIQKISREIGLSYGIEIYDYYFSDGKLIFVHETFKGYVYDDKAEKFDYTKTETNFIGRYYFMNNKLIESETTGHNRFEDDSIEIESTLVKEVADCLNKLNKKFK